MFINVCNVYWDDLILKQTKDASCQTLLVTAINFSPLMNIVLGRDRSGFPVSWYQEYFNDIP